ncbi:hypothetical protein Cni_G02741 [Canna indica]|uniref:Uncharacterized protein n=1 Tax=Canna indica TaxID=4628 RepID=A0AAQ3JPT0_9LILI|nr:hypothetical protein Cni_G02741 [Canna indica]
MSYWHGVESAASSRPFRLHRRLNPLSHLYCIGASCGSLAADGDNTIVTKLSSDSDEYLMELQLGTQSFKPAMTSFGSTTSPAPAATNKFHLSSIQPVLHLQEAPVPHQGL